MFHCAPADCTLLLEHFFLEDENVRGMPCCTSLSSIGQYRSDIPPKHMYQTNSFCGVLEYLLLLYLGWLESSYAN